MLTTLFAVRPSDLGAPAQISARWLAQERKQGLQELKHPAHNRPQKRALKRKKEALLEELKQSEQITRPLPEPSLLPDIRALIDAYNLILDDINETYSKEALDAANRERNRLEVRANQLEEEEDLILTLLMSL